MGKKHRSGFRKCVRSSAPEREGEPESEPSPSFPAQVQPPGCAVMSRECASRTRCIHLPPLARPAGTTLPRSSGRACPAGRHSLALGAGAVTEGPLPKGKDLLFTRFLEEHSCLQLLLQRRAVMDQTPVLKTHSVELSQAAPGAVVDLFSSCTIKSLPEATELKLEGMQSWRAAAPMSHSLIGNGHRCHMKNIFPQIN